jgi:hypothetical protein
LDAYRAGDEHEASKLHVDVSDANHREMSFWSGEAMGRDYWSCVCMGVTVLDDNWDGEKAKSFIPICLLCFDVGIEGG